MCECVCVCVCQAIMAAPDLVAFKETPDAEKPVPPYGYHDNKSEIQIINEHWFLVYTESRVHKNRRLE